MTTAAEVLSGEARWCVLHGDCLDVLDTLPADSFDSCCTDVPYELGFMGRDWDRSGLAFNPETYRKVLRVLKPGAHLLVFGGTRTYHRIACAIEDAGFEIRDSISVFSWLYASGFPKSLNISKAMDKADGVEHLREVVHRYTAGGNAGTPTSEKGGTYGVGVENSDPIELAVTRGASEKSRTWDGWGTALKPAWEPVIVARKPLIGTVVDNVLAHSTGAINIDACRVATNWDEPDRPESWKRSGHTDKPEAEKIAAPAGNGIECHPGGRWPPNVLFVHHPECDRRGSKRVPKAGGDTLGPAAGEVCNNEIYGKDKRPRGLWRAYGNDDGTETVAAYDCHDGRTVTTLRWMLDGHPVDAVTFLSGSLLPAIERLAGLRTRSTDSATLTVDEIANACQLTALPSFRACCPSCLRSCGEQLRHLQEDARASAEQLSDALARVYRSLCSPQHNQPSRHGDRLSSSGDAPRRNATSRTPSSKKSVAAQTTAPEAETHAGKSDIFEAESPLASLPNSNRSSSNGEHADTNETPFHSGCIDAVVRVLFVAACRLRDLPCESFSTVLPTCPVRELERQSGVKTSGPIAFRDKSTDGIYGAYEKRSQVQHCDTGTAARFFPQFEIDDDALFLYCAKAARAERELGCDRLPAKTGAEATSSKDGQARLNSPRTGAGRSADRVRNSHPTVKPTELIRYLLRLVTRKDGVNLDFTCGSGTGGVAAVLEEMRFVGIELNDTEKEPFVTIARARIDYYARAGVQRGLFEAVST